MSELESQQTYYLYRAAAAFSEAYGRYSIRPDLPMRKANAIACMASLIQAAENHEKQAQEEFDAKTSLEPPF